MDWLTTVWGWLTNPDNQKTLGFVGGVICTVAGTIWKVYEHYDAKKTKSLEQAQQSKSIAVGKTVTLPSVSERVDIHPIESALPLPVTHLSFEPDLVVIPAGPFWMGSQRGPGIPAYELPRHQVVLPAYQIGKYPITNQQYAEFIKREKQQDAPAGWFLRQPPRDKLEHPVTGVSWFEARAYCEWLSQATGRRYRLPTEAEWEKAARGTDGWQYPWGDAWEAGRCQQGSQGTAPVSAYPGGASGYGCCDLLGNVQQWTSTLWGSGPDQPDFPYPYDAGDGREDPEAEKQLDRTYRIHRGGSYRDPATELRCTARGFSPPDSKVAWRGLRVALTTGTP